MAPNSTEHKNILDCDENNNNDSQLIRRKENEGLQQMSNKSSKINEEPVEEYKIELAWRNILAFIYLHGAAIYAFTISKYYSTYIVAYIFAIIGSYGISSGAHRLFAHKTYKANMKMKVMMVILQTIAFQNSVLEWVRDHRVHHKYTDTNADPHNASRGFFFSHIGWLMCKKHPDVKRIGSRVDMSDLSSDPILRFQHKYYLILMPLFSFVLPISISCFIFGESFRIAWYTNMLRYVVTLHVTWSINSVSHLWGNKPFEKDIKPTDTYIIGFMAFGEGWHNYHHVFPWDYKVSELPRYWCNFSIAFIDFFAWIGWATDLKTASDEMIRKRVLRTGDGTHPYSKDQTAKDLKDAYDDRNNNIVNHNKPARDVDHFWGYGDDDMIEEDMNDITILHKKYDT